MTLEKNMIEKLKTTLFSVLLVFLTVMTVSSAFAAERITYIHFDALGSAIAGSDAEGASVWREDYQPYGDRIVSDGSTGNNLWYTGKASFENFGLSYFGARWYDPVVGRFTGIDPVGYQEDNIHSFNRYVYANNNPYKFVDPDGRAAETFLDIISFGLSVANFKSDPSFINGLGLAYDGLATVVPFLPAGFGIIKNAGKAVSGATKSGTKPLLGKSPVLGKNKNRINTKLEGGTATAKSIFRNQTKGQKVAQEALGPKGGIRRFTDDGTAIRLPNNGGGARIDLPGRGSAGRETIHFTP